MRIVWSLPVPGVTPDSTRGDVVRARSLVEALRCQGHDVRLVAAGSRYAARGAVSAYRSGVRRLLPGGPARAIRDVGRLVLARSHARATAREVRASSADVIVETQVHLVPSGRLAAVRAAVPLVLDDCSPPKEEEALGAGLPAWVTGRSFGAQVAAAEALVVSSNSLAARLARVPGTVAKLHVIPNGVHPEAYTGLDGTIARRELGLEDAVVVGFVGSFQPWHRLDLLLDAIASAPDRPRLALLLVGDGPERESTLAMATHLGLSDRLRAPGAVPSVDVPRLLSACDIGVLPGSNAYGHPMKMLEYAAAGIPAVAPDLVPVREVLRPGVSGLAFAPGDASALRSALVRLASDRALRRRLGGAAGEVVAEWSWRVRARAFARLLELVCRRGRS